MLRVVVGFAVAALWLPALGYVLDAEDGSQWFVITGVFTVPLTVLVAVPLYGFYRARFTLYFCALTGLGIGYLGVLLLGALVHPNLALIWSLPMLGTGLVSAILFWIVGVWRNGALHTESTSEA